MAFEKLVSFAKKVADLADKPSISTSELKAQFDAAPDEVRIYLNKLIDALKKTTSGDSGAKNIGATTITGLTGSDVQSLLESLKTYADTNFFLKKDNKPSVSGSSGTLDLNANASKDVVITYPDKRFSQTPVLNFSQYNTDIDGAYLMAISIVAQSATGATIRVKNKGTTLQYVIINYDAVDR